MFLPESLLEVPQWNNLKFVFKSITIYLSWNCLFFSIKSILNPVSFIKSLIKLLLILFLPLLSVIIVILILGLHIFNNCNVLTSI